MVNITWSITNGGSSITTLSHGNGAAGSNLTAQTIYIRHNGNNPITNCKVYLAQKSGAYTGAATAAADYNEMLEWGNANLVTTFGGLQFNFNAVGAFPNGSWGTYDSKSKTNGEHVRTGVGDSIANAIALPTATGATSVGLIEAGSTPNVRFQARYKIPSAEGTLGARQMDLRLRYTYTS